MAKPQLEMESIERDNTILFSKYSSTILVKKHRVTT